MSGNMLILNHDFFPIRSVYGDPPYYFQFSSNIGFDGLDGDITTEHSNPDAYYDFIASTITYEIQNNRVLNLKTKLRKERNLDYVYNNFIKPLIAKNVYDIYSNTHDKRQGNELTFKPKEPPIDKAFIIPAYDRYEYFKECLKSIKKYTRYYCTVVIDHTKDGLIEKNHKDDIDIIIRPEYNLGFARAMNRGVRAVLEKFKDIRYFIFCNEDVEFIDSRWWDGILEAFKSDPKLAAVNPNSPIDKPGGPPVHKGKEITYKKYDDLLTQYCDLEGTCMWCTVIPIDRWKDVGEFDAKFYPAGGEDYDWHYRAYLKGYRIISTNKSWAVHYWSRYNKNVSDEKVPVLPIKEELRWNDFHKKWGPKADIYGHGGYSEPYDGKPFQETDNVEVVEEKPNIEVKPPELELVTEGHDPKKIESEESTAVPRFSIVIPAYNRANVLPRCLDSIVSGQSGYDSYEIIIVDDGSTDNTLEVVEPYLQKYSDKITYVKNVERMERVYSTNRGIQMAVGEYITYIGSDDEMHYGLLTKLNNHINANPDYKIFNYGWTTIGQDKMSSTKGHRFEAGKHFDSGLVATGSFCWHKSLTSEIQFPVKSGNCYEFADNAGIPGYSGKARTLGNPWGEDYYTMWRLTRKHSSKLLPLFGVIVHIRGTE